MTKAIRAITGVGLVFIAFSVSVEPLPSAGGAGISEAAEAMIAQAAGGPRDSSGRDESYWRSKADNLRQQLEEQQVQLDSVNAQEKACDAQQVYHNGRPRDCAAIYRNNKIAIETRMAQLRKRLEVDLPEEARRAGAYPGWVR